MGQWAGPDVVALLDELHAEGVRRVLYVPIGTVYENIELLYAIDVLAAERAAELGIQLQRAGLPNDDPALIGGLAELIEATAGRLEAE
jgi:ferrochelatase